MVRVRFRSGVGALLAAVFLAPSGLAQVNPPTITAIVPGASSEWKSGDTVLSGSRDLTGVSLDEGVLTLGERASAMLYSASGNSVIFAHGPAAIHVRQTERRIVIGVQRGSVAVGSSAPAEEQAVELEALADDGKTVELRVGSATGWLYLSRDSAGADVAFDGDGGGSVRVSIAGTATALNSGQILTLAQGQPRVAAGGERLAQFVAQRDTAVNGLGLASARLNRIGVQSSLFVNILTWDQASRAGRVIESLQSDQFRPEVRVVTSTVASQVVNTAPTRNRVAPTRFAAANEVPLLSPAAISVGGLNEASRRNADAARLLEATGSRGLGFNGPAQLAIPGFINNVRTLGPAGLSGTR